jgi:hypothetical protein
MGQINDAARLWQSSESGSFHYESKDIQGEKLCMQYLAVPGV